MATVIRHFWGWDAPVLEKAVSYLMLEHTGDTALDLEDTLLIVPTSEAGRRIKEALARANQAGALVPWVWTAEQALLPVGARKWVATPLQSQMAWQKAVKKVDLAQLKSLFPVLPEDLDWRWQAEMARLLSELNTLLGAAGQTFTSVGQQVNQDSSRWDDLALIEKLYTQELEEVGLVDAQSLKSNGAEKPQLPEGVQRVVVLAAPDLLPLFRRWVQACEVPVTVAVQAPAGLAHSFDEIGRPLPVFWGEDASVTVPLSHDQVHLHHYASAQAAQTIRLLADLAPLGRVAVGVGDPEVGAVLQEKLFLEGVRVFEPGGVAPTEVGLWHVLGQMLALVTSRSWKSFATLLRVPEVRSAWMGKKAEGMKLLMEADDFALMHMPVTLDHAAELGELWPDEIKLLKPVMDAALALVAEFRDSPLPQAARTLLILLYGERDFSPDAPQDQLTTSLADAWLGCCREIEEEIARFGLTPNPEEALALSLEALSRASLSEPRGEIDLVLQGWLELLWEPSPNLVITGVNEEHVPGILIAHPFLPDRVRQQLGLPCQATRFARDAYTLAALTEQRVSEGKLHVMCGQWSERGDALRPSRLLFLCDDAILPQRVTHLFPKEESSGAEGQEPVRTLAWKLTPKVMRSKVETISPSRLRSYLECPFRDYLSHELRMEETEVGKRELAPNEFGTLAHHAFQKLAVHAEMKLSADASALADFLIETAVEQAHQLYGQRPAPLIHLQLESLKQRLRHAAETEAAERAAGWMIYAAEWVAAPESPLLIEGARLSCKVDRIDRHLESGQLRVIDFKTADQASDPLGAHVRKITGRSQVLESDEWKCFELSDGNRYQWKDLQLPLYAAVLQQQGLRPDSVGYFTLPKSVQETKVLTWKNFSEEWVDHALTCAAEIVRRLREGLFWPPSAKAYRRSFDELFLGDMKGSTNWAGERPPESFALTEVPKN